MSYLFVRQPLAFGRYEPEGIYLSAPFAGTGTIVQQWGDAPEFYSDFTYNGVPLKGSMGLGFDLAVGTQILAVDQGRVMEISYEEGGWGRYIKMEHRWGESLYACLRSVQVESGQKVERADALGTSGTILHTQQNRFHFGMRIHPFNRFDGWGGFSDPLPFLNPTSVAFADEQTYPDERESSSFAPLPMPVEHSGMRRP